MSTQQINSDFTTCEEIELGLSRRSDPATSHEAARSVDATRLEAVCLDALRNAPAGLTSEELAEKLGESLVTVSPRLRPLANKGFIEAVGRRPNRSRRLAIVWKVNHKEGR